MNIVLAHSVHYHLVKYASPNQYSFGLTIIIDVGLAHHTQLHNVILNPFCLLPENRSIVCWKCAEKTLYFCHFRMMMYSAANGIWRMRFCCKHKSEHFRYANIISGVQLFQTNSKCCRKKESSSKRSIEWTRDKEFTFGFCYLVALTRSVPFHSIPFRWCCLCLFVCVYQTFPIIEMMKKNRNQNEPKLIFFSLLHTLRQSVHRKR